MILTNVVWIVVLENNLFKDGRRTDNELWHKLSRSTIQVLN